MAGPPGATVGWSPHHRAAHPEALNRVAFLQHRSTHWESGTLLMSHRLWLFSRWLNTVLRGDVCCRFFSLLSWQFTRMLPVRLRLLLLVLPSQSGLVWPERLIVSSGLTGSFTRSGDAPVRAGVAINQNHLSIPGPDVQQAGHNGPEMTPRRG